MTFPDTGRHRHLQERIALAWAEIRNVEPTSDCDFLQDGGDSIHGFELMLMLEEKLNLTQMPIELFFEHPSPAALAAALLERFPAQLGVTDSSW